MPGETDVIQHRVKLTICCKLYPLPYAMREELQIEVDSMLEMGVVRPSTSPYASPIIMVKKKDGSNRVCVDFRKLNKITEVDPAIWDGKLRRYSCPRIKESSRGIVRSQ